MAIEVNVTNSPDLRAWQGMFEKAGGVFAQQLQSAGRTLSGGYEKDKKTGEPMQKAGDKLGQLVRMMPAGGAIANVTTAFKQGGMMTAMLTGVVGVVGFVKGLLSQSKIFGAVSGAFFKMAGAMMDMALMPMVPLMMRFLAWFHRTGFPLAQEWGAKITKFINKLVDIGSAINGVVKIATLLKLWFIAWAASKLFGFGGKALRLLGRSRMGRRVVGRTLGKTAMRYSAGRVGGGAVLKAGGMGAVRVVTGTGGAAGLSRFAVTGGARTATRVGAGGVAKKAGTAGAMGIGARILGSAAAKRFLAGAAVGAVAGGMMGGLPAIPGAVIGGIAALVIGQGISKAVNVATGTETSLAEDFIPFLQDYNDVQKLLGNENKTFLDNEIETMRKTAIEVDQHTTVLNQQTAQASRDFVNETFANSYVPDTVGSYIGVYERIAEESEVTSKYVEMRRKEEGSGIIAFFKLWPTRITNAFNSTVSAVQDWWNGLTSDVEDNGQPGEAPVPEKSKWTLWGETLRKHWDSAWAKIGVWWNKFFGDSPGTGQYPGGQPGPVPEEEEGTSFWVDWADKLKLHWDNAWTGIQNWWNGLFGDDDKEAETNTQPGESPDVSKEVQDEKDKFTIGFMGKWGSTKDGDGAGFLGWGYDSTVGAIKTMASSFANLWRSGEDNSKYQSELRQYNKRYEDALEKFREDNYGMFMIAEQEMGRSGGGDMLQDLQQRQEAYALAQAGDKPDPESEDYASGLQKSKDVFMKDVVGIWGPGKHGIRGAVWDRTVGWWNRIKESFENKMKEWGFLVPKDSDGGEGQTFEIDVMGGISQIAANIAEKWNGFVKGLAEWSFTLPSIPVDVGGGEISIMGKGTGRYWPSFKGTIGGGTYTPFSGLTIDTSGWTSDGITSPTGQETSNVSQQIADDEAKGISGGIPISSGSSGDSSSGNPVNVSQKDAKVYTGGRTPAKTQAELNKAEYDALRLELSRTSSYGGGSVIVSGDGMRLIYAYEAGMKIITYTQYKKNTEPAAPVTVTPKKKNVLPKSTDLSAQGFSGWEIDMMVSAGMAVYGQTGGVVPGPRGSLQPTLLHGGEMVLPTHLGKGWRDSTRGGMALKRGDFGGGGGQVNMMNKPTTINIMTTESAVATIESIERMQMMDEASFYSTV